MEDSITKDANIQTLITVISKSFNNRLKWLKDKGIIRSNYRNISEFDEDIWNILAEDVSKALYQKDMRESK